MTFKQLSEKMSNVASGVVYMPTGKKKKNGFAVTEYWSKDLVERMMEQKLSTPYTCIKK
jgi:GTP-sensing pleiotropic transcriptional regulator CodY